MIKSTLKIARYCPLVIQGFSNFLGLFQVMTRQTPKQLVVRFFFSDHFGCLVSAQPFFSSADRFFQNGWTRNAYGAGRIVEALGEGRGVR